MRVLTIIGTRPEIIRLSLIMKKLDAFCEHKILHTGQNYTPELNDVFFEDFGIRKPDVILESKGSLASQLSSMFVGVENFINEFKPDKILTLGDTNSGLCSIIAERMGIPVYHMEAGNRCFDLKVPEEINRKIIDHTCSYNLVYTPGARENLLKEGIDKNRIFYCGNPIKEVIDNNLSNKVQDFSNSKNTYLKGVYKYHYNYCLATIHRTENVDDKDRLFQIISALDSIGSVLPVIFSCHPKTKQRIKEYGIKIENIRITDPVSFSEFFYLERQAYCILTDSGTVMEEASILNKPCVVVRDSTERPEIFENSCAILSGTNSFDIINAYNAIIKADKNKSTIPTGYEREDVSSIVVNFLLSKGI